MATTVRSALLIVSLVLAPAFALAGPCDAFFAFDGNLVDSSGSGHDGRMVGAGGTPAEPEFVEGRSGQALRLDGESAMRTLLDLHPDACPQVTITAWVNVPSGDFTEGHIVSTEGQHGPALRIFGNSVHLVGANGITRRDVLYADTWNFVALVYDSESALYRLHFGNRAVEAPMGEILFEPGPATWIGAYDQSMRYAPNGILVDELRIIGAALDEQRIAALRDSTGSGNADALAQSSGSSLVPGASCSSTAQCPADSYCAVDRTCHPDSHLPMTASGSIGTGPRDIEIDRSNATPDLTSANGSEGSREQAVENIERDPLHLGLDGNGLADLAENGDTESAVPGDSDQAPEPQTGDTNDAPETTMPHAVGDPVFSSVSGYAGDIIKRVDLEYSGDAAPGAIQQFGFMNRIEWGEKNDRPCRIEVGGVLPDLRYDLAGAYSARETVRGCGSGDSGTVQLSSGDPPVVFGEDEISVIGRLQVCNNNNRNRRLKGLRIWGDRINADGTTTYLPNADSDEFANCAEWGSSVFCPADTVGTGLVIHATQASGDNEQIVGLQLICRSISIYR